MPLAGESTGVQKSAASFWHSISSKVDLREWVSEWLLMAGISLVQVPGSVEEERLFSKLAFIKDERRNCLQAPHLNACLVLATQRMWEFKDFPLLQACDKWFAAKKRRPAAYAQQQLQQQQPAEIMELADSDSD